jgi:hypothetical protein
MPTPIIALIGLAIASVVLDVLGGTVATDLRADLTLALFVGRLMFDVAIVASLFLRRRLVWVSLTTVYALALLWRSVVLVPALLGLGAWPLSNWGTCLILGHAAIAAISIGLLFARTVRGYFEANSTAGVGD